MGLVVVRRVGGMSTETSPFTETTGTARFAAYDALAARGPVQRLTLFTGVPVWLVTGYAEARAVLTHPDVVRSAGEVPHRDTFPAPLAAAMNSHMLAANPPDHTRLRRLVSAAFTRRRVAGMAPRIEAVAAALADDLAADGAGGDPVDLVARFAYPLPITVIADLVGVPEADRPAFRRWSSIATYGPAHPADVFVTAVAEMVDYLRELIAARTAKPADDLLSELIRVHEDGDRLSADELTSTVFLLLAAGHETTANLISIGTYRLLTEPDQLALLRAAPERIDAAVEELLRQDGPAQVTLPAVTRAPVRVGDVTVPAGDVVVVALVAANRDPARYAEPARLDLTREPAQHLAFGHGIHHCLGAPLARLEGRTALRTLLDRFPRLRLAEPDTEPQRPPGLLINALTALPVRVD
ncbi:cytochrome P450 [Actinocatenispora rupis]|uniref:Cytochrome P450 n=2 Tax=Actinocatenispora rupis TaxID=519421 RepID=A0A8J3JD08_9ACTN|nr:cytochrome P450 [Actinocatenispora rupis]